MPIDKFQAHSGQPRRGTAAEWLEADLTLAEGEVGYEVDTRRVKRGDGVTPWSELAYEPSGDPEQIREDLEAVSLDELSNLTTMLTTGLAEKQDIVGTYVPVSSSATKHLGVPDTCFFATASLAMASGGIRYTPMYLRHSVNLQAWVREVTVGPASAANFRVGIYLCDDRMQPVGAPLYDSGNIAVASGYTGGKSATMDVTLDPGNYMIASQVDVAMTFRAFTAPAYGISASIGSTPYQALYTTTSSYGAYATPAVEWSGTSASGTGAYHSVAFQWVDA